MITKLNVQEIYQDLGNYPCKIYCEQSEIKLHVKKHGVLILVKIDWFD